MKVNFRSFSLCALTGMLTLLWLWPIPTSAAPKKNSFFGGRIKLFTGNKVMLKPNIEYEVVRHRLRILAEVKKRADQIGEDSRQDEVELLEAARDVIADLVQNIDDSISGGDLGLEKLKNPNALRAMARSHVLGQYFHQLRIGFDKIDAEAAGDMAKRKEQYLELIDTAADLDVKLPGIEVLRERIKAYKNRKKIARKKAKLLKEIKGDAVTTVDSEKIFGGIKAGKGQLPYVVAIRHLGGTCTGTLISKRVVLTAAHCVCDDKGSTRFKNAQIIIGDSVDEFSDGASYSAIAGFVYYPPFCRTFISSGFTRELEGNDLALFILDRNVTQTRPSSIIDPIGQYMRFKPTQMQIVGFGWTENDVLGVKMKANIDVADAICDRPERFGCRRGEEFVLRGRQGRRVDTCQGDSGGPVFYVGRKRRYLTGVTSRAVAGGECGDGGIYTLLTPGVISWLEKYTGDRVN